MGFYGNLMHKYKKNEITIPKNTICGAIIYLFNYIQILNLNKKIIHITEFLNFITTVSYTHLTLPTRLMV